MKKINSIKDMIYSEYLKAALLPMLLIELMLLIMYFSITGYIAVKTRETLLSEAKQNINEITLREVKNINQTVNSITAISEILQKENQRFFANPNSFNLPNPKPLFSNADNKVYYKTSNNGGASLFYSNLNPLNVQMKNKALATEAFDPIFKAAYESNPNNVGVYFNSFDSMCRYYPFLKNIYNVFPANMNIPTYNFYYLADKSHNPSQKPVWTDAYLDPAGQGWMASCIAPIYSHNNFLEGVTGIDVSINNIINNILNLKLPWKSGAFLVDKNGVILAMPTTIESILGLKELKQETYTSQIIKNTVKPEEYNLFKNKDPEMIDAMQTLFTDKENLYEFSIHDKKYIASCGKITSTDWRLIVLVDEDEVFQSIYKLNDLSKKIGYIAFGLMILFYISFFSYLVIKSKKIAAKIASPISELAERTSLIKTALRTQEESVEAVGIVEMDMLIANFNEMIMELKAFYIELEKKVSDRTRELDEKNISLENALEKLEHAQTQIIVQEKMAGLGQLAAGVAHEINNPMAFVYSNLSTLQGYIAKFNRTLEGVLQAIADIFKEDTEKYNEFLSLMETVKKNNKYEYIKLDSLELINETIGGAERVRKIVENLRSFAHPTNEVMDLSNLNDEITKAIDLVWNELKYNIVVIKEFGTIPAVLCNQGKMVQVFVNLLMNSKQAMTEITDAKITIRTYNDNSRVYLEFEDNGSGIKKELLNKVLDPFFTTKDVGVGTGLGLSIVHRIIADHNGHINIQSEEGKWTLITLDFPIAKAETE